MVNVWYGILHFSIYFVVVKSAKSIFKIHCRFDKLKIKKMFYGLNFPKTKENHK